jgi:hypothetical protein
VIQRLERACLLVCSHHNQTAESNRILEIGRRRVRALAALTPTTRSRFLHSLRCTCTVPYPESQKGRRQPGRHAFCPGHAGTQPATQAQRGTLSCRRHRCPDGRTQQAARTPSSLPACFALVVLALALPICPAEQVRWCGHHFISIRKAGEATVGVLGGHLDDACVCRLRSGTARCLPCAGHAYACGARTAAALVKLTHVALHCSRMHVRCRPEEASFLLRLQCWVPALESPSVTQRHVHATEPSLPCHVVVWTLGWYSVTYGANSHPCCAVLSVLGVRALCGCVPPTSVHAGHVYHHVQHVPE